MIARSVDLRSIMQKGSWCFGAWDLCHPNMSKLSHRAERRTLKKKKRTTITGRDVLNRSQKRRVQRLYSLEEAKAKYLEMLRKACPDLVDKVHHTQKRESCPPKKDGVLSQQEPMRRHRLTRIWCLYSLRSSTPKAMKSYQ
jgi:hypothetical protein